MAKEEIDWRAYPAIPIESDRPQAFEGAAVRLDLDWSSDSPSGSSS